MPPGLLVSPEALLTLLLGYCGNLPAALSPHYHGSTKWCPHYQLTDFQSDLHTAPSVLNTGKILQEYLEYRILYTLKSIQLC